MRAGRCVPRTPPEQALRRTIDDMHAAVEARDVSGLSDGIARDFIGRAAWTRRLRAIGATGVPAQPEGGR
jgi:hypothetical protein